MRISVVDINDHDPAFEQSVYSFLVPENDASGEVGQFVGQVVATDLDQGDNGRIVYEVSSRTADGIFAILEVSYSSYVIF